MAVSESDDSVTISSCSSDDEAKDTVQERLSNGSTVASSKVVVGELIPLHRPWLEDEDHELMNTQFELGHKRFSEIAAALTLIGRNRTADECRTRFKTLTFKPPKPKPPPKPKAVKAVDPKQVWSAAELHILRSKWKIYRNDHKSWAKKIKRFLPLKTENQVVNKWKRIKTNLLQKYGFAREVQGVDQRLEAKDEQGSVRDTTAEPLVQDLDDEDHAIEVIESCSEGSEDEEVTVDESEDEISVGSDVEIVECL